MTYRDNVEGLDASILMHPRVWEASGHVQNFSDPIGGLPQLQIPLPRRYIVRKPFDKEKTRTAPLVCRTAFRAERPCCHSFRERNDGTFAIEFDELLATDDTLLTNLICSPEMSCTNCGNKGTFTEPRQFNLMFKMFVGRLPTTLPRSICGPKRHRVYSSILRM